VPADKTPDRPAPAEDADGLRRRKGRPPGADAVGREGLLLAAERLLHRLPPARISTTAVAREAGTDPALVRYYFGDREGLLFALVQRLFDATRPPAPVAGEPAVQLRDAIRALLRFSRENPNLQRLMSEELATSGNEAVRASVTRLNARGIGLYAALLSSDRPDALRAVDPLLLHVALVGLCDVFASAGRIMRGLLPAGTDEDAFARRYEDFIVELVLDGLRPR
jgi:TetR/AcrR family transcriptional regulator